MLQAATSCASSVLPESGRVVAAEPIAQLYRRYGPNIFSRCRRLLKDDAAAEDATQEVFLRALSGIRTAASDEAALFWIYRVSTNHCLNLLRERSNRMAPEPESPEPLTEHPEGALLDRDLAIRLLTRVPDKVRAPALLYFVDGFDQQQIAEILGISRRTVTTRLADFTARSRKYVARQSLEVA